VRCRIRRPATECSTVLFLLLCACESLFSSLPNGAQSFDPPAIYQQWWNLTEECSGLSGSFGDVKWYRVEGESRFPIGEGALANGAWEKDGNRIILAGDAVLAGDLVRHEMLHSLLKAAGHPRSAFVGKCDGTVVCTDRCLSEGGEAAPPDPSADSVSPSVLDVNATITPSAPSSSILDGNFTMIVTAKNRSAVPVIIRTPRFGFAPVTFSFLVFSQTFSSGAAIQAEAPESTRFAASEEKQFVFDFHIGFGDSRYEAPPGNLTFLADYGSVAAPGLNVVVSP
jgi:hypothetical protein